MLLLLIVSPFIAALLASFVSKRGALFLSFFPFWISLVLTSSFDTSLDTFQFIYQTNWLVPIRFGIDGISLPLILLTTFLTPLTLLMGWKSISKWSTLYNQLFLLIEGFLLVVFTSMDLLTFYIFFESILIPMFLVIGIWGSRERKIQAAYQFLLYTLLGSLFMLVAIIYLWLNYQTTDILLLSYHSFSLQEEKVLWLLLFLSFVVKIPLFPFHIWLPEAHVEAPTAGSVILAGILLKLGGYGFLRISLTLFPHATTYFSPLVLLLSTLSILYISLTAIRQIDLKKIIAYSSISHMGFVTFALVTNQLSGLQGALLSMVSHGLVASALFFVVGLLYDRHKTRILSYYRGLAIPMPLAASLNFLVILANIGLPLTSSFVGELMTLTSLYHTNKITTLLVSFALLLTPIYSLSYFNKAFFGSLTPYLSSFRDLTFRELMILVPLVVMILYLGIAPNGLFLMISSSLASLISS